MDDIFKFEYISQCQYSPDGVALAMVVNRTTGNRGKSDLLVQWKVNEKPQLVGSYAEGAHISGWSPDGRYLAFRGRVLATQDRSGRCWILDVQTRKVSEVPVSGGFSSFSWIDGHRFLCCTYSASLLDETRDILPVAWKRQAEGRRTTASVLSSGVTLSVKLPPRRLILVDVSSMATRELRSGEQLTHIQLSPDRVKVALFRQLNQEPPYQPKEGEPIPTLGVPMDEKAYVSFRPLYPKRTYVMEILDLAGNLLQTGPSRIVDEAGEHLMWAADGKSVLFWDQQNLAEEEPSIFRAYPERKMIEGLSLQGLSHVGAMVHWTGSGEPIVFGKAPERADTPRWWVLREDNTRLDLAPEMTTAPYALAPLGLPGEFMAVSDGALWRLEFENGQGRVLKQILSEEGTTAVSLVNTVDAPTRQDYLLIRTKQADGTDGLVLFGSAKGQARRVAKPIATAEVSDFSARTGSVALTDQGRTGARAWQVAPSGKPELVLWVNQVVAGLSQGESQTIGYRSLNGVPLIARVILPVGYQPGRHYPILAWVYEGNVAYEEYGTHTIERPDWLNMQIAAAHGYAVLLAPMPLAPFGKVDDPLLKLTDSVIPALDATIVAGIADPDRQFVAGHSYGGYSTMGMVTQIRRFRAAVAIAGISDLVSGYGHFNNAFRYKENVHLSLIDSLTWSETGQGRMGAPPWEDLGRYLRNSPITYVDRVETPILLIHGDIDRAGGTNMTQSEGFFRSLQRRGKRTDFVRYWGEDHFFASPANIRDMWARIFAWCDEFGDIARDAKGELLWTDKTVSSRSGKSALSPQDFLQLEAFFDQGSGASEPRTPPEAKAAAFPAPGER